MVSKLESAFAPLRSPARADVARRESPPPAGTEATENDPDLRVTLSDSARRLAGPPAAPEAPGGPVGRAVPERVGEMDRETRVVAPESPERPDAPRAVAAYREAARPALGERLSIRV
jgi:hypothetical protein